jgi:predicted NBD/HSP70 family sugar kinase
MKQYAGIDVSLEATYVCVVDAEGKIVREAKVLTEPDALRSQNRGQHTDRDPLASGFGVYLRL